MNHFSDLEYKQLLFPPFRKESNVPIEEIPIYSKMTPVIPPFLPYRNVSRFAKFPGVQQQIHNLKNNELK